MKTGKTENINILVTLNEKYIHQLNVMLSTLIQFNEDCYFSIYLLHTAIPKKALASTKKILGENGELIAIKAENLSLDLGDAPTSYRYPKEIYYRIFASHFLPDNIERILYLDPDIIINGSIRSLYDMDMEGHYFAAASHIGTLLHSFNTMRLNVDKENPYINTGVMLMNLELLRKEQNYTEVFDFIEKRKHTLMLPDQDVIYALYSDKIHELDAFRYNMTEWLYQCHTRSEKALTLDWVRNNTVIIHYCGRNKPWKSVYFGQLDVFYREALERFGLEENA